MNKVVLVIFLLAIFAVPGKAGQSKSVQDIGISFHKIAIKAAKAGTQPADSGPPFIDPEMSMLKLGRQVSLQFLGTDFLPLAETETDPVKLKNLRYAVGFFRECQVDIIDGLVDVMVGLRIDTNDGTMKVQYFNSYVVFNPAKIQFQEDRMALALLPDDQCSALLFVMQNGNEEVVSFAGLFEDPHNVNILDLTDLDGVKTDDSRQLFAIFVRGGDNQSSLFVLNTDATFTNVASYEVFHDLPESDRAYIFEIVPPQSSSQTSYRAVPLKK